MVWPRRSARAFIESLSDSSCSDTSRFVTLCYYVPTRDLLAFKTKSSFEDTKTNV